MKKLIGILLALLVTQNIHAQNLLSLNTAGTNQTDYFTVIPYEASGSPHIIILVEIDGKKYRFMFDTGAPNIIGQSLYNTLKPTILQKIPIHDQSGKTDSMLIVNLSNATLGGVTFYNTPSLIANETMQTMFGCLNIDGIIGSNMLFQSIVRLSSADSTLTLTDNKEKLNLDEKKSTQLLLSPQQSTPYILVEMINKNQDTIHGPILFDTGMDEALHVGADIFNALINGDFFKIHSKGYGSNTLGLHGVAERTELYNLYFSQININGVTFKNVPGSTTDGDSKIGIDLLRHGIATLNYKTQQFYFEPYKNDFDLKEKRWNISPVFKNNQLQIGVIWDEELGKQIEIGDQITAIDGVNFENTTLCDILLNSPLKKKKEKTNLTITVKDKSGNTKNVTITKK